jgi:hypothetical protein
LLLITISNITYAGTLVPWQTFCLITSTGHFWCYGFSKCRNPIF